MKEAGIAGLVEQFADLPDPPVEGRTDHDLLDIIALALCVVMAEAEGWDDLKVGGANGRTGCGGIFGCAM